MGIEFGPSRPKMKWVIAILWVVIALVMCNASNDPISGWHLAQQRQDRKIQRWVTERPRPIVVDEKAFPVYAKLVTTMNFTDFINSAKVCLIVFFHPDSPSFFENRGEIDYAAEYANTFMNNTRIGIVDATLDPFLQQLYAIEMKMSWQQSETTNHGFRFGRKSFYPLIIKLFRDATMIEEFTDVVRVEEITRYLYFQSKTESIVEVSTIQEFYKLKSPMVVGCHFNSNSEKDMLVAVSKQLSRQASFILLSEMLCKEIMLSKEPIPTILVLHANSPSPLHLDGPYIDQRQVFNLISRSIKPFFSAMLPDNSWLFLKRFRYLAILLEDPSDRTRSLNARESIEHAYNRLIKSRFDQCNVDQKEPLLQSTVGFVHSDGLSFGGQFGVSSFPTLVLVDTVKGTMAALSSPDVASTSYVSEFLQLHISFEPSAVPHIGYTSQSCSETLGAVAGEPIHCLLDKVQRILLNWMLVLSTRNDSDAQWKHRLQLIIQRDSWLSQQKYHDAIFRFYWSDEFPSMIPPKQRRMSPSLQEAIEHVSDIFNDVATLDQQTIHQVRLHLNETIHDLVQLYHKELKSELLTQQEPRSDNDNHFLPIPRVDAAILTIKEFVRYAEEKQPIIITGIKPFLSGKEWTLDYIRNLCCSNSSTMHKNNQFPKYFTSATQGDLWGGLKLVNENVSLNEFLDTQSSNKTRQSWYLHDMSILYCPELVGLHGPPYNDFIVPRFIASDYLQRAAFTGYSHTWPSIFIGANGTETSLHLDSGSTAFVLFLIQGEKEWIVYNKSQLRNLYFDVESQTFDLAGDLFNMDWSELLSKYPLLNRAKGWRGVQKEGELMFIPANNPHAVKNIGKMNVGWSANFVDISNRIEYLQGALMSNQLREFEMFIRPDFPNGMDSKQRDLTFGEFKSQRWRSIDLDLM